MPPNRSKLPCNACAKSSSIASSVKQPQHGRDQPAPVSLNFVAQHVYFRCLDEGGRQTLEPLGRRMGERAAAFVMNAAAWDVPRKPYSLQTSMSMRVASPAPPLSRTSSGWRIFNISDHFF
jgi:hypothetical protein